MSVSAILRVHVTAPTVSRQTMNDKIGIRLRAYDHDGDELGEISLPTPVVVGDIAALEDGPAHEIIISVLHADDGAAIA